MPWVVSLLSQPAKIEVDSQIEQLITIMMIIELRGI